MKHQEETDDEKPLIGANGLYDVIRTFVPGGKFSWRETMVTRGVWTDIPFTEVIEALGRHYRGDWGDELVEEDRQANEEALQHDGWLLSAYRASTGEKFWIITEWDRSVTTVLLPDEY